MDLISKYDLIERIVQTEDEPLLWQVKHLLEEEQAESWADLDAGLKAGLKRALVQSDNDEVTPTHKVMARFKKS